MAIIRTDPFREFDRLTQQLLGLSHGPRPLAMPMDAYRKEDTFLIQFDLPGVDADAIELTVEDTVLTVKVDRPAPPVNAGVECLVSERPYGTFSRQVFLGDNLDSTKIEAHYEAGVLTLSIPLAAHAKPRRIPVVRKDDKQQLGAASSAES
ncbi:MAG TPA: Hsp20/alpha crystallin family protein [Acidimicrobiales bacterium]|nr:Hsp20/alpha crystallin family protein [Acidimicrobiales bacterium]